MLSGGVKAGSASGRKAQKEKTISEIAQEVLAGKWGNGEDRKAKLKAAGYDYAAVQTAVNQLWQKQTTVAGARP